MTVKDLQEMADTARIIVAYWSEYLRALEALQKIDAEFQRACGAMQKIADRLAAQKKIIPAPKHWVHEWVDRVNASKPKPVS